MAVSVRPLRPEDDRSDFRSGDPDLDTFLRRYAGQNQFRHHIGTTYVAEEEGRIAGFATVAASHLEIEDLPASKRRRLPEYPLPVLRLARLATDERERGRGIARELLRAVFAIAHRMAEEVGCIGVVVDAKPGAVSFYEELGFLRLEISKGGFAGPGGGSTPLFLELSAIPKP